MATTLYTDLFSAVKAVSGDLASGFWQVTTDVGITKGKSTLDKHKLSKQYSSHDHSGYTGDNRSQETREQSHFRSRNKLCDGIQDGQDQGRLSQAAGGIAFPNDDPKASLLKNQDGSSGHDRDDQGKSSPLVSNDQTKSSPFHNDDHEKSTSLGDAQNNLAFDGNQGRSPFGDDQRISGPDGGEQGEGIEGKGVDDHSKSSPLNEDLAQSHIVSDQYGSAPLNENQSRLAPLDKNQSRSDPFDENQSRPAHSNEDQFRSAPFDGNQSRSDPFNENQSGSSPSNEDHHRSAPFDGNQSRSDPFNTDQSKIAPSHEGQSRSAPFNDDQLRSTQVNVDQLQSQFPGDHAKAVSFNEDNSRSPPLNKDQSQSPFNDDQTKSSPFNDDQAKSSPFNDDQAKSSPFNDDQAKSSPFNDDQAKSSPFNDDQAKSSPFNDDQAKSSFNDDQAKSSPFNDDQAKSSPFNDDQAKSSPFNDDQAKSSPFMDDQAKSSPFNDDQAKSSPFNDDQAKSSPFNDDQAKSSPFNDDQQAQAKSSPFNDDRSKSSPTDDQRRVSPISDDQDKFSKFTDDHTKSSEYDPKNPSLFNDDQVKSSPSDADGKLSMDSEDPSKKFGGGKDQDDLLKQQQEGRGQQQDDFLGEKDLLGTKAVDSFQSAPTSQPEPAAFIEKPFEKPPESFQPVHVGEQMEAPKPQPAQVPTKAFEDKDVFKSVDAHAMQVSQKDHGNFRDFLWHLLHGKDGEMSELEKPRTIFLWLCSKDLTELKFDKAEEGSPEQDLVNLRDRKTTYAKVFSTLCSYAGLHCQTINGIAKGAEYKAGDRFTDKQGGHHAWNAVHVDGVWRLVDCHWASRRLVGKDVSPENVRYKLDEYYFMPNPQELIYTHFPDDEQWQLLEKPITQTDFEDLVLLKSNFFKHGLKVLTHQYAVVEETGELAIKIECPADKAKDLAFTFTLHYENGKEEFNGTKLTRFAMLEMVDSVSTLRIRLPEKNTFRLTLFSKDLSDDSTSGVYGAIAEYQLVCPSNPGKVNPFPPCVHTSWGSGDEATRYQLVPLQEGTTFNTVQGKAEVRFEIPKPYRFTAKLRNNDVDEKTLQSFVLNRVVDNVAIFTMYAPQKGEFGLEIYANDPELDGNSLSHVYQYLIKCEEEIGHVEAHPTLPISFLGEQQGFRDAGLSTVSHSDPLIQADGNQLKISFNTTQPLRITSQLFYVVSDKNEDQCSDFIIQQGCPNEVHFQLTLPDLGWYKFQIYAIPASDPNESFPLVYNYLIRCNETSTPPVPFPKQYGLWKEGCYLHSPLLGHLNPSDQSEKESILFKLSVPQAQAVAIVVGDDWTHLEQGEEGAWMGEVAMASHWGQQNKAMVYANCDPDSPSYSALLEYSM